MLSDPEEHHPTEGFLLRETIQLVVSFEGILRFI